MERREKTYLGGCKRLFRVLPFWRERERGERNLREKERGERERDREERGERNL